MLAILAAAAVVAACGPNGGATPVFSGPPGATPQPASSAGIPGTAEPDMSAPAPTAAY